MISTQLILSPTTMTLERALELINANHARKPMTADEIAVYEMRLSSQRVDSHHTRMAMNSLNNYAEDAIAGRSFMNSHRTGGWSNSGELPMGRTFHAEVDGVPLPADARYDTQGGAALTVWFYVQRGLRLTEVSTDDVINGIDGGTINDVSIGFDMTSRKGWYRCGICSCDLFDWENCFHIPGTEYGDHGRCYAWVENAGMREASAVYKGSTPDAMITKAIRMFNDGHLPRRDALMLEDQWGVRLTSDKTIAVTKPETVNAAQANSEPERKEVSMWETFLEGLRSLDSAQADRIAALPEAERLNAVLSVLREQRSTITSLEPSAKRGEEWINDLIKQAVETRTRAQGAVVFDAEKAKRYEQTLRTSGDPAFIKDEIAAWDKEAQAALGGGRQIKPAGSQTPTSAPSSAYRG